MKGGIFNNKQRGIGLLELMLALAIIAILLVMATRYYIVTSRNEQINRGANQLGAIQGAISNWKGANTSYTGLTPKALNDIGGLAQADYTASQDSTNGNIVTPFSTYGTVGPNGENTLQWKITYPAVPSWACQSLQAKYKGASDVTATCDTAKNDFTLVGGGN